RKEAEVGNFQLVQVLNKEESLSKHVHCLCRLLANLVGLFFGWQLHTDAENIFTFGRVRFAVQNLCFPELKRALLLGTAAVVKTIFLLGRLALKLAEQASAAAVYQVFHKRFGGKRLEGHGGDQQYHKPG